MNSTSAREREEAAARWCIISRSETARPEAPPADFPGETVHSAADDCAARWPTVGSGHENHRAMRSPVKAH